MNRTASGAASGAAFGAASGVASGAASGAASRAASRAASGAVQRPSEQAENSQKDWLVAWHPGAYFFLTVLIVPIARKSNSDCFLCDSYRI